MNKLCVVGLAALVTVTACDGLKEAMTAHVDVAARAGSQELSVQRLGDLMGKSQVPLRKDVAQQIADVWVNYQLAAKAAAEGETFKDTTILDKAMSPIFARSRQDKWYQVVSASWKLDTTNLEQHFNSGELLAASHILFQLPQGQKDSAADKAGVPVDISVKRKAESVLKQTNSANFAAMAKKYGSDATKDQGGSLGVFPPAKMIPEFSRAVAALKPGEIGPLVQTQFGYHIVRRNTYAESKDAFRAAWDTLQKQKAESTYVANVQKSGNIQVKPNAAKTVKDVAADLSAHADDKTAVATSVVGNYTAGQVAKVISGSPQPEQLRARFAHPVFHQEPGSERALSAPGGQREGEARFQRGIVHPTGIPDDGNERLGGTARDARAAAGQRKNGGGERAIGGRSCGHVPRSPAPATGTVR